LVPPPGEGPEPARPRARRARAVAPSTPPIAPVAAPAPLAPLHLHWSLEPPSPRPAWPDQPRMQFDAVHRPLVAGELMLLACARTDSVTAHDTDTGELRWRFRADGPVRFAPTVWRRRAFVVSDDGHLYCLELPSGKLRWKHRGGPSDRRVLGNER